MKLDPQLIYNLLAFYESNCSIPYPTANKKTITEHMVELIRSGFLIGELLGPYSGIEWDYACIDERWKIENAGVQYFVFPLTDKGVTLLDAARNH